MRKKGRRKDGWFRLRPTKKRQGAVIMGVLGLPPAGELMVSFPVRYGHRFSVDANV